MSTPLVLVLNCGSSSIKFAVINPQNGDEILNGLAERLFSSDAQLIFKQNGEKTIVAKPDAGHSSALQAVVEYIQLQPGLSEQIKDVGHRVVHGGEHFRGSVLITDEVMRIIDDCHHLAPLHNPANLAGVDIARQVFPNLPHTAVFDTAFHQSMPAKAFIYPLPYELYIHHGVRRYGFHGTSYRYVSEQAAKLLDKPLEDSAMVIAHLGNGASVSAVLNGKSVDTSMGMTPNEGIVHGTRSGSIDPSIHEYLNDRMGLTIQQVNDILWKQSGLLGISGVSNDCRTIEDAADRDHERSKLALEIYSYRLAKMVASLVVPLGRLDALVFTGGIGENSERIRKEVINQLGFLGLKLDETRNAETIRGASGPVTSDDSASVALVVPTNEELMIAQDAAHFIEQ